MRVLFIRDNAVKPDVRVEKEIKSLIDQGINISVLGWDKMLKEKTDDYIIDNKTVNIHRFKIKCSLGGGFKKNIIPLVKFQFAELIYLLKHINEFDVIHACDFNTAFTASIVCMLKKKPYIYDIFDYYVDTFSVPKFLKKFIEKLDHNVIKNSYRTILCSEKRVEQVGLGESDKYVIVHNSPINEEIDLHAIQLKSDSNKYKISYIGTLAKKRRLDIFANAIQKMDDCEFHVAGFGELEEYFKDLSLNSKNIFFYGKTDYKQTLCLEKKCDAMVALYPLDVKNHVYAAPNKFYEALMLGKPLMMIKGSGMSEEIEKNGFGALVDESIQSMQQGINEMIELSKQKNLPERMNDLFIHKYNWDIMGKRIVEIYKALDKEINIK